MAPVTAGRASLPPASAGGGGGEKGTGGESGINEPVDQKSPPADW